MLPLRRGEGLKQATANARPSDQFAELEPQINSAEAVHSIEIIMGRLETGNEVPSGLAFGFHIVQIDPIHVPAVIDPAGQPSG